MVKNDTGKTGDKGPSSVLFMCSMNAIRSPMAEEIAKRILPKGTYVQSAGARKGKSDPFLEIILDEAGMSGAVHEPRALEELGEGAGLNELVRVALKRATG